MTLPVRAMPPARSMLYRYVARRFDDPFDAPPMFHPAWPIDVEGPGEGLRNCLMVIGALKAVAAPSQEELIAAIERRVTQALALVETGSPP